jgi:hypothetical protein
LEVDSLKELLLHTIVYDVVEITPLELPDNYLAAGVDGGASSFQKEDCALTKIVVFGHSPQNSLSFENVYRARLYNIKCITLVVFPNNKFIYESVCDNQISQVYKLLLVQTSEQRHLPQNQHKFILFGNLLQVSANSSFEILLSNKADLRRFTRYYWLYIASNILVCLDIEVS